VRLLTRSAFALLKALPGKITDYPARHYHHRTTGQAAEKIHREGFNLDHLGHGAGMGMLEEPAGIHVSEPGDAGFDREVAERGLHHLDTRMKVHVPPGRVWEPSGEERRGVFTKLHHDHLRAKHGVNDDQADALRRHAVGRARSLGVGHLLARDHGREERDLKEAFRQHLIGHGVQAVRWKEPVRGVNQTVILDPKAMRPQR